MFKRKNDVKQYCVPISKGIASKKIPKKNALKIV